MPATVRVVMISSNNDSASAPVEGGGDSPTALPSQRVGVDPITSPASFKNKAYAALKDVIVSMDVYRSRSDIRLDERRLALEFGISRTPVREAMAQLERDGFVRSVPRRGIYVVRKTIGEKDRADRSIRDHMHIIEALEARDTARAEELVRAHALGLADHVAKYADYLD